jgi:hypothetical protein
VTFSSCMSLDWWIPFQLRMNVFVT